MYGISIGSLYSQVHDGTQVVAKDFAREIPNFVSFQGNQRIFGVTAELQKKDQNTVNIHHSKEVYYQGQKTLFHQVQLTASYLNYLIQGELIQSCVVSYPGYVTEKEKRYLLDSCKIVDLPLFRMVSEPFAVSRAAYFDNTLFIDFGYRKLSLFLIDGIEIRLQSHHCDIGVRDIDLFMFEQYCQMFQEISGGISVKMNKKAEYRLQEAIEKQRKELSSNKEATLLLESLVNEYDLEYPLKREQYEELIGNELNKIQNAMINFQQELQDNAFIISQIELLGGGCRMPIIQRLVKQVFMKEGKRTVQDAIVVGCANICKQFDGQVEPIYHEIYLDDEIVFKRNEEGCSKTIQKDDEQERVLRQKDDEIRKVKGSLQIEIDLNGMIGDSSNEKDLCELKVIEKMMQKQDEIVREIQEMRNEIESIIYKKNLNVDEHIEQLSKLNSRDGLIEFKQQLIQK